MHPWVFPGPALPQIPLFLAGNFLQALPWQDAFLQQPGCLFKGARAGGTRAVPAETILPAEPHGWGWGQCPHQPPAAPISSAAEEGFAFVPSVGAASQRVSWGAAEPTMLQAHPSLQTQQRGLKHRACPPGMCDGSCRPSCLQMHPEPVGSEPTWGTSSLRGLNSL